MFPFAFDRRKIAQAEWRHEGILEAFDEVKSGHARLALRSEAAPIDQLVFEGGEKTLAHRIVVGVADQACRWTNAARLGASAEGDRPVFVWRRVFRAYSPASPPPAQPCRRRCRAARAADHVERCDLFLCRDDRKSNVQRSISQSKFSFERWTTKFD